MQKIILLFLFFMMMGKLTQAQTSKVHVNVLTSESRKLYVDFDNHVKIYVEGVSQKDMLVKCSPGYILKSPANDSLFVIKFSTGNSNTAVITVSQQVNGQIKKLATNVFPLRAITTSVKFEKGCFKDAGTK